MLSLKSLTPFLFSLAFITSSHAVTVTEVLPWDNDNSSSSVFYKSASSDTTMLFSAFIEHSKSGKQRLYFQYDSNYTTVARPSARNIDSSAGTRAILDYMDSRLERDSSSTVIVVNGQAIKMLSFIKHYSDTKNIYYYYTPETEAGHNYLINIFKKSKSPVEIDFRDDKIYIPTLGFTKIWNNHGGNAI